MASPRTPSTLTALVLAACTGASAEVGSDTATTSSASTSTAAEAGGTTTHTSDSISTTTAEDSTTTGTTGTDETTTSTGSGESSSTTAEGSTSTTGGGTDDLDCLAAPDDDPSAPWSRTFTGTVDFGAAPMTSGDEGEVFLRVAP